MTAQDIWLLEDDPAIAQTVVYALQREGFAVTHDSLVALMRERLRQSLPSLLILDIGLPDGNGLDLCRELRLSAPQLPVIMLSARGEELDRVLALELGADDYVTKPFSPRELVARVRALLRRSRGTAGGSAMPATAPSPASLTDLFILDEAAQRVSYAGVWLTLTRLEYRLLCVLLAAPQRIHSRAALLDAAWGGLADVGDRTVDTHIKTLRAKLRECRPDLDPIATHRGMGYSLADRPPH